MSNDILAHREGGILTLTFNRLDKKNAITAGMYTTLAQELEQAAEDDAVRVAVIQGDVSCFTAGNDLGDFTAQATGAFTGTLQDVTLTLDQGKFKP